MIIHEIIMYIFFAGVGLLLCGWFIVWIIEALAELVKNIFWGGSIVKEEREKLIKDKNQFKKEKEDFEKEFASYEAQRNAFEREKASYLAWYDSEHDQLQRDRARLQVETKQLEKEKEALSKRKNRYTDQINDLKRDNKSADAIIESLESYIDELQAEIDALRSNGGVEFTATQILQNENDKKKYERACEIYYPPQFEIQNVWYMSCSIRSYKNKKRTNWDDYTTSLQGCTCQSYIRDNTQGNHRPCKHMIWLAYTHGLIPSYTEANTPKESP